MVFDAGLRDKSYLDTVATCHRLTREDGIDRIMREHDLRALDAPTTCAAWAIDWVNGDNSLGGSGLPLGISFDAGPWSEDRLIGLAHAFEEVVQARITPGPAWSFLP